MISYSWQSDWNVLAEEVLKKALILQAKLRTSPEQYEYMWTNSKEVFDESRMVARAGNPWRSSSGNGAPMKVAFTLIPGVVMLPFRAMPGEILAKMQVLVME